MTRASPRFNAGNACVTDHVELAIAFGVLTCQTMEQAMARAGGAKGNKGAEAARAAIEMAALLPQIGAATGPSA